jgi:hypothetical protein
MTKAKGQRMEKLSNFGDRRQTGFCVHCGGSTETKDHAPSKIFLDLPYPPDLPTLPCCETCNQSFSNDEEYLGVFIDCVLNGTTEPARLQREKTQNALKKNDKLRARIERSKKEADTLGGGKLIVWQAEEARVRKVVIKLARCHAAFELNEPQLDEPTHVMFMPLALMSREQREQFEDHPFSGSLGVWPEVGSRAMQRVIVADKAYNEGWLTVQAGRYRYMAVGAGEVVVRGVLSEYLAFEVTWE